MSRATEIAATDDETIREYPPRASGGIDYALGHVTVSYRAGGSYLCGSCSYPANFQNAEHKGCAHIARIVKFREEQTK